MAKQRILLATVFLVKAVAGVASRARAADQIDTQTYRKVGNRELKVHIQKPADAKPGDSRPAIVLFHGGGWVGGLPRQFDEQVKYLITRGIVCIQPAYRLLNREDSSTELVDASVDFATVSRHLSAKTHVWRFSVNWQKYMRRYS